jgi:biotin carboxyl carrier protein
VQYDFEIDGRPCTVGVAPAGDGFAVTVDGRTWQVDAARIDAGLLSLLIADLSPKGDTEAPVARVSYEVAVERQGSTGQLTVGLGSAAVVVMLNGRRRRRDEGDRTDGGPQRLIAPMPGRVVRVFVKVGDVVRARQPLVVVEAMKMENELRASRDGRVAGIHVKEGASVDTGALLVEIE